MKTQATLFVMLMVGIAALAQAPDTLWTRTYGETGSDFAKCVQETDDGGFIMVGTTGYQWFTAGQAWLVKTDAWGDTMWTRTFGDSGYTFGEYVRQTFDGGYILCGTTNSIGAGGGDAFLMKTDSNGNCQWIQTYGGDNLDEAHCVQQTSDSGYVTVGNTTSWGGCDWDLMVIKTDSLGNETWIQVYPGYENYWDHGYCIRETDDGGYIVSGKSAMNVGSFDFLLVKTDSAGNADWTQTYGTWYHEAGRSVQQTADQGFIMVGEANDESLNNFLYLVKTDFQGDTIWTRRYFVGSYTGGNSLQITADGGYLIAGYCGNWHTSNAFIIKTDAFGDSIWSITIGGGQRDLGYSIRQTADGGFIFAGSSQSYGSGEEDFWLIRLGPETPVEPDPAPHHPTEYALDSPYPNPFNPAITVNYHVPVYGHVQLSIYNIMGQLVTTLIDGEVNSGSKQVVWNSGEMPSGIYFVRIEAGDFRQVRKVVLLK